MGLLGYSTISLTDLTEVLPASLYLSSSLVSNSQTKEGSNYTPDFSVNGNEVIITPSFFMGTEEIVKKDGEADCPYKTNIRYQCGEVDENGAEITYSYMVSGADNYIWVDSDARLHYKKNLTKSIIIEAWIEGWTDTENQISYPNIPALNPINILLLTETGGYSAFIASKGGREHFEEGDSAAITLVASLYNGATKVAADNYKWYQASNVDVEGNLVELTTDANKGINVNGNELTVERKAVKTLDTFICEITISTGLVFRVSMNILDKTDSYYGNIISDGSLVLTPEHGAINLTSQIWSGTVIINGGGADASRFVYEWFYLNGDTRKTVGDGRALAVNLAAKDENESFVYPQNDSFIIYCQTKVDNKTFVLSNISIQYSPVSYNVQKRPETFFVPTLSGGNYYSSDKTYEQVVSFSLVGVNGQPLTYNKDTDVGPSFIEEKDSNNSIFPFTAAVEQPDRNKWSFKITFTYSPAKDTNNNFNGLNNSFYFTFNYAYLGVQFQDEYICVKNEAGASGNDGASAYTIYLDNEFVSFSADSLGELTGNKQTYTVKPYVYLGANAKAYKIVDDNITVPVGMKAEVSTDKQKVNVSIDKDNISSLLNHPNGTISISIKVDDLTFIRGITYSVRFSSIEYYLQLSESSFTRDLAYVFSPSQITVAALYKRAGQEAPNACTSGKLKLTAYGEGGNTVGQPREQEIGGTSGGTNTLIIGPNDLTVSIKYFVVELFNNKDESTLYDRQTIPILVDSGDIEVGGVNLLRYSKKMPSRTISEKEYWWLSNTDITDADGNVTKGNMVTNVPNEDGKMVILKSTTGTSRSARMFFQSLDMPSEGFASYYTLTLDMFVEENQNNDDDIFNNLVFDVALHCTNGKHDTKWRVHEEQVMKSMILQKGFRVVNGELAQGKWARIAYSFSPKFDDVYFNNNNYPGDSTQNYSNVKYVSFSFFCEKDCNLKIKKIKLEKGNIPTDWSESPYDVEYEDIKGTNLLSSFYETKIYSKNKTEGALVWHIDFDREYYTLSWNKDTSISTDSNTILRGTYLPEEGIDFKSVSSYTFSVEEVQDDAEFLLYTHSDDGDEYYVLYQLKLEKGTVATPYAMTVEQIQQYYQNYVNRTDGVFDEGIISVTGTDGVIRNMFKDDFERYSKEIATANENYTNLEGKYTTFLEEKSGLWEWENYYKLGRDAEGNTSVLELGNKSAVEDFKMRLTPTKLAFTKNNNELAYFSSEKLFINQAEIVQQMRIGSSENTGYLVFKHMSGGLGVVWETK